MSISKTVEELVQEQPMLLWSIEAGIVNYSAASEYLKPSVERRVGKKVSTESILMGLRRINLVHAREVGSALGEILSRSKYSIENNFTDIVVDYALEDIPRISRLLEAMEGGDNVSLITGLKYASLITDSPALIGGIEKSGIRVVSKTGGLAIFRIKLPKEALRSPGVISIFTSEFAKKGVNIVELESSYLEIGYIISEKEIGKALDAFNSLKR